jgi:hypothetical protein
MEPKRNQKMEPKMESENINRKRYQETETDMETENEIKKCITTIS